ncbi:MAG: TatD family hydrolase [Microbacteriaceae bacterium]|nr:TatD family hydrolase [Microbacteriaceae bacterium]MDR9444187.1 TatD family hydrolase [Microbacteriaceae bacterium]
MTDPIRTRKQPKPREYPEIPEPLVLGTFDNHTHLEIADSDNPLSVSQQIEAMKKSGMLGAVQVGVTLESSKWSAEAASNHPELLAAVALHPNEAPLYGSNQELEGAVAEIAELATQERVRAIGETGLDYFRTEGEKDLELQSQSFEWHIEIAKQNNIAMQIHDRDAHADVVETLKRVGAPEKTVFHCYSGDVELARICNENGWYMSFAGNVTFKKNTHLQESFLVADSSLRLIETDAPFLAPEPIRGRPNAPYLVPHTLRYLAFLAEISPEQLASEINANTLGVYGSWDK